LPNSEGGPAAHIVFIDEIHRFNKAQQDAFLPASKAPSSRDYRTRVRWWRRC
jgi:hypothetical protein